MGENPLIDRLIEHVESLPPIVDLSHCKSLAVLGDTHGYPEVTRWFFKLAGDADCRVLLGDYVDRGPQGVENLELIASEALERGNVIPLRGNHEDPSMNAYYGFTSEAVAKRGREYIEKVSVLFRKLPHAAYWKDKVFLVHGGIPCRACSGGPENPVFLEELYSIMEAYRSQGRDPLADPLILQLLWNDPDPYIDWFSPNIRGPGTFYYGVKAWTGFLDANRFDLIVRAHETVNGLLVYRPDRTSIDTPREPLPLKALAGSVITVFSSLYHGKSSGAIILRDGMLEPYYYRLVSAPSSPSRGGRRPGIV